MPKNLRPLPQELGNLPNAPREATASYDSPSFVAVGPRTRHRRLWTTIVQPAANVAASFRAEAAIIRIEAVQALITNNDIIPGLVTLTLTPDPPFLPIVLNCGPIPAAENRRVLWSLNFSPYSFEVETILGQALEAWQAQLPDVPFYERCTVSIGFTSSAFQITAATVLSNYNVLR